MKSLTKTPGMYAVALGTAGGPKWWGLNDIGAGISTAIVIDGVTYIVDYGYGASRQLMRSGHSFADVEAVFLTHMHSDHLVDLPSLLLFAHRYVRQRTMTIIGPGPRGVLPPLSPLASMTPKPVSPHNPVPGTQQTFERLVNAYATDINDRMYDYGSPSPASKFAARDIQLPPGVAFDPNDNVAPVMEPFEVYSDARVKVSAILVDHHPTAPAFAYRFDSKYGSIVVAGDTGYCENSIRISQEADTLFHEVIDLQAIEDQAQTDYDDPGHRKAVMSHHKRSHTTPQDAGRVATAANVKTLVLHHYVPADSPVEVWKRAAETFDGTLVIPADLDVVAVQPAVNRSSTTPVSRI